MYLQAHRQDVGEGELHIPQLKAVAGGALCAPAEAVKAQTFLWPYNFHSCGGFDHVHQVIFLPGRVMPHTGKNR